MIAALTGAAPAFAGTADGAVSTGLASGAFSGVATAAGVGAGGAGGGSAAGVVGVATGEVSEVVALRVGLGAAHELERRERAPAQDENADHRCDGHPAALRLGDLDGSIVLRRRPRLAALLGHTHRAGCERCCTAEILTACAERWHGRSGRHCMRRPARTARAMLGRNGHAEAGTGPVVERLDELHGGLKPVLDVARHPLADDGANAGSRSGTTVSGDGGVERTILKSSSLNVSASNGTWPVMAS